MEKNSIKSRSLAVFVSILIYAITIGIVIYSVSFIQNTNILIKIAIADLLGTIIIFFFSILFNNSSLYDPYWSVKPIVIVGIYFYLIPQAEISILQVIVLILVGLYAFRLTANFYQGWEGFAHEDWRYQDFRKNFPKLYWPISFFGIHLFPSIMVYLGCLPMFVIFKEPIANPLLAGIGSLILFGSVILAYIADQQLRKYRLNDVNKGKTIRNGLWKKSRHPNYMGEILTWWGLYLIALGCGWEFWWTGIGAITITLMFRFISIPLIEKHSIKRRSDYKEYQQQVPMLLPSFKNK